MLAGKTAWRRLSPAASARISRAGLLRLRTPTASAEADPPGLPGWLAVLLGCALCLWLVALLHIARPSPRLCPHGLCPNPARRLVLAWLPNALRRSVLGWPCGHCRQFVPLRAILAASAGQSSAMLLRQRLSIDHRGGLRSWLIGLRGCGPGSAPSAGRCLRQPARLLVRSIKGRASALPIRWGHILLLPTVWISPLLCILSVFAQLPVLPQG